ncbi:hypothetical protein CCAND38_300028 [Capnocytophaga canis]|uniref:Uncharacterized protein n=1 Tax=Capnocytophaga canis TaxID=1848903 RepID=A0A0B7I7R1_9FLAO|nr:hypothetical protein CCAND38_300028 [Capnocytophaga canis]
MGTRRRLTMNFIGFNKEGYRKIDSLFVFFTHCVKISFLQ